MRLNKYCWIALIILTLITRDILAKESISLTCKIGKGTSFDFEKKQTSFDDFSKNTDDSIIIFDFTSQPKGKVSIIGNNGKSMGNVLSGNNEIHILEVTDSQNVIVYTISLEDKTINNPPIVMSRHIKLFGILMPSQYYGYCRNS